MSEPLLQVGEYGTDRRFKLIHEDTFPGNTLNLDNWRIETMESSAHRVGSKGINDQGELEEGATPKYKRHSAWYHKHHDKTLRVNDGLYMGVHITDEFDLTRQGQYEYPDGQIITPGQHKIYLGWIDTCTTKWFEEEKRRIVDTSQAHLTWRYGFFEIEADFSKLSAEGIRQSAWLTPVHEEDGTIVTDKMYDRDPRELECDIYEVEVSGRFEGKHNNKLQQKNLAGKAGNSEGGEVCLDEFKINLLDGKPHVIGHFWEDDRHTWYCDGYRTNEDRDRVMQVFAQLILSREANSGLVGPDSGRLPTSIDAVPPWLPKDTGLYLTDCYRGLRDSLGSCALIKRVSVYQESPVNDDARKRKAKEPAMREPNPNRILKTATRDEAPPVTTDREFTLNPDGTLSWAPFPFEAKWNVYLDGKYHKTVLAPECAIEEEGKIEVEGLSVRSVAIAPT